MSGHPAGDDEFQVVLYTSPVLSDGSHQLVIQDASTDASQPFMDIDFVRRAVGLRVSKVLIVCRFGSKRRRTAMNLRSSKITRRTGRYACPMLSQRSV